MADPFLTLPACSKLNTSFLYLDIPMKARRAFSS